MNNALIFLLGILMIFGSVMHLNNALLKSEITSIHKTLARREKMDMIYADRYNFLR